MLHVWEALETLSSTYVVTVVDYCIMVAFLFWHNIIILNGTVKGQHQNGKAHCLTLFLRHFKLYTIMMNLQQELVIGSSEMSNLPIAISTNDLSDHRVMD